MKTYKTTNETTDEDMAKSYFGILGRANEAGVEVIMNYGFNLAPPYILTTVADEVDPQNLFPDFEWQLIETQEVMYEEVTELGDPVEEN